ncbi:MAG TPA: hypothetical protein VKS21_06685 [Spirochaetota bacterium]|nr:hypothetical protein [Spirochaetota bacterium]
MKIKKEIISTVLLTVTLFFCCSCEGPQGPMGLKGDDYFGIYVDITTNHFSAVCDIGKDLTSVNFDGQQLDPVIGPYGDIIWSNNYSADMGRTYSYTISYEGITEQRYFSFADINSIQLTNLSNTYTFSNMQTNTISSTEIALNQYLTVTPATNIYNGFAVKLEADNQSFSAEDYYIGSNETAITLADITPAGGTNYLTLSIHSGVNPFTPQGYEENPEFSIVETVTGPLFTAKIKTIP